MLSEGAVVLIVSQHTVNYTGIRPYLGQQVRPLEEVRMVQRISVMCSAWHLAADIPKTEKLGED